MKLSSNSSHPLTSGHKIGAVERLTWDVPVEPAECSASLAFPVWFGLAGIRGFGDALAGPDGIESF